MTAPDPLSVRAYNLTVKGARKDATDAIRHVQALASGLDSSNPITALGDAQRLITEVGFLVRHLASLRALDDVSFLITDQDAKEA